MSEEIIKFLTKYSITHLDDHTSIISEYEHFLGPVAHPNKNKYVDQSSLSSFLMTDSRKFKNTSLTPYSPVSYLVKDMIIDQQPGEEGLESSTHEINKKLEAVLETLSMHQQLSNKYILTLIHYQVFKKSIPNARSEQPHAVSTYEHENQNQKQNQSLRYYPLGLQKQKQKNIHTRIEQSLFNQQQNEESFIQNFSRNKSITHFSQCNNQDKKSTIDANLIANPNTNRNNVSLNGVGTQLHTAIRAVYEYGKITLKQEIKNRIISSTQFQEEELWAILATLVQALSYLEQEGIVYGVLGTDKIFINNSLVKILDPSATATDPLLIASGRLYSPQILNDNSNIDMFKSDVYIIGLVLLECALLINLGKETEPNINKYLNLFAEAYSKQLVDIVELCLAADPKQRPCFQDLKQYLAKQLDMNDFESAYDNNGAKLLQPLPNDPQDTYNPAVNEIEVQLQQYQHDVLYESIGEEELKNRKRNLTEYEKAKLKYLGLSTNKARQSCQRSSASESDKNSKIKQGQKRGYSQSQQHRYTSSSPIETKRNSKLPQNSANHFNFQHAHEKLPNLNMAISESIYPESVENKNKNINTDKTNRKNHQLVESEYQLEWQRQKKSQKMIPNSNQKHKQKDKQKLKKTKEIKQKLVKAQNNENTCLNDQTFGTNKPNMNSKSKPINKTQVANTNKNIKYNRDSIREQAQEESESSCIYYNNASKHNNSIGSSQLSELNQSNSIPNINAKHLKGSQRYRHGQYQQLQKYNKQNNENMYANTNTNMNKNKSKIITKIEQDQIFTDPNLLRTIKDDLARISTKNIKLMGQIRDRQREREREKEKYFN